MYFKVGKGNGMLYALQSAARTFLLYSYVPSSMYTVITALGLHMFLHKTIDINNILILIHNYNYTVDLNLCICALSCVRKNFEIILFLEISVIEDISLDESVTFKPF